MVKKDVTKRGRHKDSSSASMLKQLSHIFHRYGFLFTITVVLIAIVTGYYVRYMPYNNYKEIVDNSVEMGLGDVSTVAYFGAMDPLIEYWLANYLHTHGLSSWDTLKPPNPAVMKFWYPWGRDFTRSEKPFIPFIGALPPSGLSVAQWVTLIPPIFGALLVLIAAAYMYRLYGEGAAIAAALLAAVLPSSIIRTYAGFVEKVGVAMPFLVAAIWIFAESLRRKDFILAALSGIIGGFIALVWGGYLLAGLVIAATAILSPLASSTREEVRTNFLLGITGTTAYFITLLVVRATSLSIPPRFMLLPLIATIVFFAIYEAIMSIFKGKKGYITVEKLKPIYAGILILSWIAVLFTAPSIGISGKYYYAMLGPLRGLASKGLGVIEFTVAENNPPSFPLLLHRMNIVLFVAPIAGLYLLYRALRNNKSEHLPLSIASLAFYYAVLGMAYFEQVASVFGVLATAAMLGDMVRGLSPTDKARRAKALRPREEIYEVKVVGAALLAILVFVGIAAGAAESLSMVRTTAPIQLDMPSMNAQQYGWLYLLHLLRTKTSNDTVVVAWWDYGYLITVGSDRATVADGSTSNGTQIKLLAKFFTTTSEEEASNILKSLRLKPNKTLVLIHEAVLYNPSTGAIIYSPSLGDIAKSSAMLLIAGVMKLNEGLTQRVLQHYLNSTIYKMFVDAPYHLNTSGILFIPFKGVSKGFNVTSVYVAGLNQQGKPVKFKHFKPYLVLLSPFVDRQGNVIIQKVGNDTYILGIAYIVYQWIG
ncbi:STT3 domain-containing protein [Pyrofollis japonicus]|uniref:STT3 domain-containing protein n=1 Tax=Pyrofollis japonicus TaxID=3060460 RepID=UPI00295A9A97|nr:STT3 domain-containing protein [Pyrofollis japonicus]BEP17587.1 STT3 domain-containing protein [Pyrofollis japonicus]